MAQCRRTKVRPIKTSPSQNVGKPQSERFLWTSCSVERTAGLTFSQALYSTGSFGFCLASTPPTSPSVRHGSPSRTKESHFQGCTLHSEAHAPTESSLSCCNACLKDERCPPLFKPHCGLTLHFKKSGPVSLRSLRIPEILLYKEKISEDCESSRQHLHLVP